MVISTDLFEYSSSLETHFHIRMTHCMLLRQLHG